MSDPVLAITEEMVERGAIAIREEVGNKFGRGVPWEELPSKLRESYRAEARVCLIAALAGCE